MPISAYCLLSFCRDARAVSIFFNARAADADPVISLNPPPSIKGCYVARLEKDVYSLAILSQNGESFEGTLVFKNFEKDSSSGTYKGTYKNGILLGKYSFQEEGTNSVMEVIFKKQGSDFIRGYGPLNEAGDGFANLDDITYGFFAPFKASSENCATSL